MDCSEGAFLSLTAVHIHPNVTNKVPVATSKQEPTKPFCMSYLTLWIIWGLPGSMSLFQLHSLMFLLTHEYNPAQNTAKLPRCVIYISIPHCMQAEILCWHQKRQKIYLTLARMQILVQTALGLFLEEKLTRGQNLLKWGAYPSSRGETIKIPLGWFCPQTKCQRLVRKVPLKSRNTRKVPSLVPFQ